MDFVHPGVPARITLTERPGYALDAQVTRTAGELDTKTRKLLTEIDVDNTSQQIVSGSFLNVTLKLKVPSYLEVPAKSLVIRNDKPVVPVIQNDNTIHFQEVHVAANDGKSSVSRKACMMAIEWRST